MEEEETITKQSKFDQVGFWNRIFNIWAASLFKKGYRGKLKLSDLSRCPSADESERVADLLEREWKRQQSFKTPSFGLASMRTFGPMLIPIFAMTLVKECIISTLQPIMLANMVNFFANPKRENYYFACLNALGVVIVAFLYSLLHHPHAYFSARLAIQARVAWVTLIYRKAFRLNLSAFGKTTVGQILNLMTNDVARFDEFAYMFCDMIVFPIQTCLGVYVCYLYIGWVSLIGLFLLIFLIPVNYLMGKVFQLFRAQIAAFTDIRINIMAEIIKFIRTIKMYAWEKHFSGLISEARKKEMNKIRYSFYFKVLHLSISLIASRVILFAILIVYVSMGNTLNAYKVYVVISVINVISFNITYYFPYSITYLFQILVSCKRVEKFLLLEETENSKINKMYDRSNTLTSIPISICNVSVQWNLKNHSMALNNVTLELSQKELLVVIGTVGSGKSTLLMTLLNESKIVSGSVSIHGKMAYASQETWCFNASVEQNILLGQPFDRTKLDQVIEMCALRKDLAMLPHGEKTLVGERGVILSGGQKARITLARALYSDADIYLLDDPLSAVDAQVANHIVDRCIGHYLQKKTVVLVTHQVQFIKKASKVLVLDQGRPLAYGTYDEILCSGIDLITFIQKINEIEKDSQSVEPKKLNSISEADKTNKELELKIVEESKESGSVKGQVYWKYFRSGAGPVLFTIIIISLLASKVFYHLCDIWISRWTSREDMNESVDKEQQVTVYSLLVAIHFVTTFVRSLSFHLMCIFASIKLHNRIFFCLIRAPVTFFDNSPSGRILNRFTKDMGLVDESMPSTLFDFQMIVADVIGAMIIVAISKWYFIVPGIVLALLTMLIRAYYLRTARELKRYEGIVRSPLYNHTTVTLSGLATIRAFQVQPLFVQQYYRYQNDHTAVYFASFATSRLMSIVIDFICDIYILCITAFLMAFYQGVESGAAGLAMTMAISVSGMMQWAVRLSADLENQMTSVERIYEYSKLEPEASLQSEYSFPENWPARGQIEFAHVTLTYQGNTTPVLKNLTFTVQGGEKVSIVGRTGAGKSSMLAALFRMVEVEGRVEIDGVDCRSIGLHELRSKMSIIPQEPMAFVGTLRKNLDPFDEHTDQEVWEALDKVQLRSAVTEMPGQLSYLLSEGGGNLSLGQRQLICLARALLRKNQILILDEATANVDHQTDELIQRTISCFAQCTVITIAHRLNTIIDSDRILVLDAGRVVQFDTPRNLLQDRSGIFYNLVQQTGPEMAAKLIQIAN